MSKPIKIAATIYWAFVNKQDNFGNFSVTLGNLSDKAVEALQGIGVKAKSSPDKPDQGNYISCKSQLPITVLDEDGDKLDVLIANGSKGVAVISAYDWTFKNRKGRSPSVGKLVVTDLKEYKPDIDGGNSSSDDDDIQDDVL